MLVLTRKSHEQIQIGDNITVTILRVKGNAVRVGVDAPRNVTVLRKELQGKPAKHEKAQVEAVAPSASVDEAATTKHRRSAEGGASILAGGKTKSLTTRIVENPRRNRLLCAAAPLSGFLAAR